MITKDKIQQALDAGYTPEQINKYIADKKQDSGEKNQTKSKGLLGTLWEGLHAPAETFTRTAATAAAGTGALGMALAGKGYETLTDKTSNLDEKAFKAANWLNENVLEERTRKAVAPNTTFGKTAMEGIRQGAGISSYFVPAGGGSITAAMGMGTLAGGLRAGYEEESTAGQVLGGAAGGALASGLMWVGGKVVEAGLKAGKNLIKGTADRAAQDFLKATGKDYEKVAEVGINPKELIKKYNVKGKYEDLVGPIEEQLGQRNTGVLQQGVNEAEAKIQEELNKNAGKVVNLKPVYDALESKALELDKVVGNEEKVSFVRSFITSAKSKYGEAIPAENALEVVRLANKTFGESIIQSDKGAITSQTQKIFANKLRDTLKREFKGIASSLEQEHELMVLQQLIKQAQFKGETLGLGLGKLDITRPLTLLEPLTKNPKVSSSIANLRVSPNATSGLTWQQIVSSLGKRTPQVYGGVAGREKVMEMSQ